MTLSDAQTRVRNLLNQTDNTNTLWSDTDFIDHQLNAGRRMFAAILPEEMIPKLRKSVALVVASGVGTYPSDFLKPMKNPHVVIDTAIAKRIPNNETWRLRYASSSDLTDDEYYYERSDGVVGVSTPAAITYEYIKKPDDLGVADNIELPADVDDLVVDFAFQKCMNTTRGDRELAGSLWRQIKDTAGAKV